MKKNYLHYAKCILRNSLSCFSFILLFLTTIQIYAQNPQCQWAEKIAGTTYFDRALSITTDANCNVYVAGGFRSTILTFNNGITLSNSGSSDAYIAKYNSSGVCQWAKKIAGTSWDEARSIITDANGNVYVAGDFKSDSLIFNNGITLSNSGISNGYIAKYNSSGVCHWAEKIAGTGNDNAYSIITDANGNVYVAGFFKSDLLTFNNGISISNSGLGDGYIAKYNSSGACQWAEKIAGTGDESVYSIITDTYDNLYIAGYFSSATLIFNNGITLSNSGLWACYIAKFNSSGVCQWAEKIAGTGENGVSSINKVDSGNVYVAGEFSATLSFNNGITLSNTNSSYTDGYIAKYNSSGVCQWAEKIAGTSSDIANSINTDANGNVYVAGYFSSDTLTFNNGITVSKIGYEDGYIAKYNSSGMCQWAEKIAGTGRDLASSISTDANGNVYVAGYFGSATLTFNNGITLSNRGEMDCFIAKYIEVDIPIFFR